MTGQFTNLKIHVFLTSRRNASASSMTGFVDSCRIISMHSTLRGIQTAPEPNAIAFASLMRGYSFSS